MESLPILAKDKCNALSCKICILSYDELEHSPIVLHCGHTICKTCLNIISSSSSNNANSLFFLYNTSTLPKCPFCKKELPKNAELILNYEIISLLHYKKFDNSCSIHNTEILNFYCQDDKILICQYCLLQNHIGHKISKPEDSEIANYIKMIEEFKVFEKGIRENKFNSNQKMKEIFKKVDENFSQYSKVLNDIKSYIKFEYYQDFEKMKGLVKEVEEIDLQLNKEYEKLKSGCLTGGEKKEDFWKDFSSKMKALKEKANLIEKITSGLNNSLPHNAHYTTFTETLSQITNLSSQIKDSETLAILSNPQYEDIENIIEYLMDTRASSIRYKVSTPMENQNLFSNSSRRVETTNNSDQVINILKSIDRADFVPNGSTIHAYLDTPMRIGWNTTISAPHMHIITLSYLSKYAHKFKPEAKAIDIGSGSGLMALAISKLLGPGSKTIALDHIQDIVDFSKNNIKKHHKGYIDSGRIVFICSDGRNGYDVRINNHINESNSSTFPSPPYQIIHVGAACVNIPDSMVEQLAPGGIMWIPVGPRGQSKKIMIVTKEENGEVKQVSLMDVNYSEMQSATEQMGVEEEPSSDNDFDI